MSDIPILQAVAISNSDAANVFYKKKLTSVGTIRANNFERGLVVLTTSRELLRIPHELSEVFTAENNAFCRSMEVIVILVVSIL